jgi:hypothetical protein
MEAKLTEDQQKLLENMLQQQNTQTKFRWDENFQRRILGILLTDRNFLLQGKALISPEYFSNEVHVETCRILFKLFEDHPTGIPDRMIMENDLLEKVREKSDAIKVYYADGVSLFSTNAAADCQLDDVYKFSANGTFMYESNGQTYVQSTSSCDVPKANATGYKVITSATQAPRIVLNDMEAGLGTPFIGTTDEVEGNSYEVKSYSAATLTLRAVLKNTGGKIIEIKLKKRADLTIADIKDILTGGSSRSWKLDASTGANAIVVGTEGNPSDYYGGGPLEPNCQVDDVYTFSSSDNLNYNANGSTFNGGNIAPNYNCGADRSFTVNYVFGPITGGASGLAAIQLPSAPPANFIGTTDVPTENYYRIIEITPTRMLLRAGNGSGTVFQFKFVRQ